MSTICSKCHSTKVSCEAIVNPNTKEFIHYTDESFDYGWCDDCDEGQVLVDTEEIKANIDKAFNEYLSDFDKEPSFALCHIRHKGDDDGPFYDMLFKLSVDIGADDDEVFFYCNGVKELKSLTEPSANDFIIIEFSSFLKS
ncbi:hypothetical protein HMPREF1214_03306 [Bacteroides sp. HPS0048]|uniref:hypothetical protein n=1 Tax=Bacteroides sp. HPS0048 TaxID=1078089 RepID=UPI0003817934|nr:hypothetical protein [Bacteroides sp. HPS0048]EOA56078.1 hypothetical protein HMPREF1214_03306 [Bacteroides sp. HPS0048]